MFRTSITKHLFDEISPSIENPNFFYIGRNSMHIFLFEYVSNQIIMVNIIGKWFKKYSDTSIKVDLRFDLNTIPDIIFEKVLNENYDFIKNNYLNGRYEISNTFKNYSKLEIINHIRNSLYEGKFNSDINEENNKKIFIKILIKLSRKEKIHNLLI